MTLLRKTKVTRGPRYIKTVTKVRRTGRTRTGKAASRVKRAAKRAIRKITGKRRRR